MWIMNIFIWTYNANGSLRVDSRLLVVGSQTGSLTPGLSFDHNLCYRCPNGSSKPFWTCTFQDLSIGINNASMQGVLTLAIALWVFGSPGGLPSPIFGSVSGNLTLPSKWGCNNKDLTLLGFSCKVFQNIIGGPWNVLRECHDQLCMPLHHSKIPEPCQISIDIGDGWLVLNWNLLVKSSSWCSSKILLWTPSMEMGSPNSLLQTITQHVGGTYICLNI